MTPFIESSRRSASHNSKVPVVSVRNSLGDTKQKRVSFALASAGFLLGGVINARDVGGFGTTDGGRVRSGLVFRSASPDRITDEGLSQLESLGVRTVVDLRSDAELDRHGRFPYERTSIDWMHLPSTVGPPSGPGSAAQSERFVRMIEHPDPMSELYKEIMSPGRVPLGPALRLLADEHRLPVLFHCTSGKDRTGMLVVALHLILGVPLADTLDDFELSAALIADVRNDMETRYPEMAVFPAEVVEKMAGADRRRVIDALAHRGALDDPRPWLDSIGVGDAVRRAIRDRLLLDSS